MLNTLKEAADEVQDSWGKGCATTKVVTVSDLFLVAVGLAATAALEVT
jgi:hypothetical protein